jgi:hypothetical protein
MRITNTLGLESLTYLVRSLLNEALNSLFTDLRPFMSNLPVHILQHDERTTHGKEIRVIHFIIENVNTTLLQYGTRDGMNMMHRNPLYRETAYVSQRIFTANASARIFPEMRRFYVAPVVAPVVAAVAVVEVLRINRRLVNDFDVEFIDIDPHTPVGPPPNISTEFVYYTVEPRPSVISLSAPTTDAVDLVAEIASTAFTTASTAVVARIARVESTAELVRLARTEVTTVLARLAQVEANNVLASTEATTGLVRLARTEATVVLASLARAEAIHVLARIARTEATNVLERITSTGRVARAEVNNVLRPQSKMSIRVSQFKSSEEDCPICFEFMGDKVVMTDCKHCICSGCMVSSLKSYTIGAKCCMCRQVVSNCTFANKTALNEFKSSLSKVK